MIHGCARPSPRPIRRPLPEDVVILGAPEEGIYLALRTLLDPGDHVVVLTPAYDSLLNLAEHISGNVSQWEIQAGEESWQLDLAQLEAELRHRPDC